MTRLEANTNERGWVIHCKCKVIVPTTVIEKESFSEFADKSGMSAFSVHKGATDNEFVYVSVCEYENEEQPEKWFLLTKNGGSHKLLPIDFKEYYNKN